MIQILSEIFKTTDVLRHNDKYFNISFYSKQVEALVYACHDIWGVKWQSCTSLNSVSHSGRFTSEGRAPGNWLTRPSVYEMREYYICNKVIIFCRVI
jgi:hypothetical protein